jgi:CheY-like chemotaxis protein
MSYEAPLVLLIEEDPILAEVTGFRLELLGFRVLQVHSAEAAFDAVDGQSPDVILLDTVLPGMDGIELTNRLSNDPKTSTIPIMVLSTNADLNEVQRAHVAGAKDYLVIPYDPSVLEEKLDRLLQRVGKCL